MLGESEREGREGRDRGKKNAEEREKTASHVEMQMILRGDMRSARRWNRCVMELL